MSPSQDKIRVLVIDDERLIRLTLSAKLKLIGYSAVCVASTQEAVALLNNGGYKQFKAVITDIMMGEMDGFVFRDILRGMDPTMPVFFITALDPEEGGGFLRRILDDNYSFYLPKAIQSEKLIKRIQSIVDAKRVHEIIEEQNAKNKAALDLAANLQRSMLPPRVELSEKDFYMVWWNPKDEVSGDLFEVYPLKDGCKLLILGDVQGHGPSAALSMMAIQSFLRHLPTSEDLSQATPAHIANLMQGFFAHNLGTYSYMTAIICKYDPRHNAVDWLSCGAPDLRIIDPKNSSNIDINPEKHGGLPIGLLEDTVYDEDETVHTRLSPTAMCVAFTDGMLDVYKDKDGYLQMPETLRRNLQVELITEARFDGSLPAALYKYKIAAEAYGYTNFTDDMTELIFGPRLHKPGIFEKTVRIDSEEIDKMAQQMEQWCLQQNWPMELATKLQLVFEEKMMNVYDHGYDIRYRAKAHASIRLKKIGDKAELTIWDNGTPEPSLSVVAGDLDTEMELRNRQFNGRGRGRLMIREMCSGVKRNVYDGLNETIYLVPFEDENIGDSEK